MSKEEEVTKILEKWFNETINTPCAYCEASKEIVKLLSPPPVAEN